MSNLTPEQLKVVNRKNGDLVVTASAGSGKTKVMTLRYVKLVTDDVADVDDILCVTFTKLASEELRSRLEDGLKKALASETDPKKAARLKEQLKKLPSAAISTVDSFCNTLVRKYFYAVDVDPQFSIIDKTVSDKLKLVAADEAFEKLYEAGDERLLLLLKTFIRSRSDRELKELVIKTYEFLSSEYDGDAYLDKSLSLYAPEGVKNVVNALIDGFIDKCELLRASAESLSLRCKEAGIDSYVGFLSMLFSGLDYLKEKRTEEAFFAAMPKSVRKPSVRKGNDEERAELSDLVGSILERYKALYKTYGEALDLPEKEYRAGEAGKVLEALIFVVKVFGGEYTAQKREISSLDYNDLERLADKILSVPEILKEVKEQYKFVFVDEYQDTNGLQEALFSRLNDGDLFIVGDEKQSIYGFRGCDSALFESHISGAESDELVSLDKNFRSSRAVVDAVNNVFGAVMTARTVGRNYADNPMIYGDLYGEEQGVAEIVLFSKRKKEKATLPAGVYSVEKHLRSLAASKTYGEEKVVADIIEKVYGTKYHALDNSGKLVEKEIGFKDIAVLTRTNGGVSESVAAELISRNIPVFSDSEKSIGGYPEIKLVVSILTAIESSGKEDYSLVTALRSPVGGLNDEQLFLIRKTYKDGSFYEAANAYRVGVIDEVSIKLNEFFEYIGRLKTLSFVESAASIMKRIVADKRLDIALMASPFGSLKVRRIERLISSCEGGGETLTVREFLRRSDAVLANLTLSFTDGEGAVRIMNVHQSKGLEFPVVILCELGKNFYAMDKRDSVTFSRHGGVGLKYYDVKSKTVYPTVVKAYVDIENEKNTLKDAARLMYVAMTRAMFALYMVVGTEITTRRFGGEAEFAKRPCDFLAATDCAVTEYVSDGKEVEKTETRLFPKEYDGDERARATIEKMMKFVYPYADDISVPVKRTVTDVVRSKAEKEELTPADRPMFPAENPETGNAYHKFLQHCSFSPEKVKSDLDEMKRRGLIGEDELTLLDENALIKITACPVFATFDGWKIYREQPFTAFIPASLVEGKGEADVLVQGVIDFLAIRGDEAVVIDYKYSSRGEEGLKKAYGKQLELYACACRKVLPIKSVKTYILNLKSCELIAL